MRDCNVQTGCLAPCASASVYMCACACLGESNVCMCIWCVRSCLSLVLPSCRFLLHMLVRFAWTRHKQKITSSIAFERQSNLKRTQAKQYDKLNSRIISEAYLYLRITKDGQLVIMARALTTYICIYLHILIKKTNAHLFVTLVRDCVTRCLTC